MKPIFISILLAVLVFRINAQEIKIDSGFVVYYPFNGNAADGSGNNNHGKVFNAILVADRYGNPNSAYWFNGTSSYIAVADDPSLNITSEIIIGGWMKKDSNVPWARMVTKGKDPISDNNCTGHNSVDNGIVFTSSTEFYCISSMIIPIDEWCFVTFTSNIFNPNSYPISYKSKIHLYKQIGGTVL